MKDCLHALRALKRQNYYSSVIGLFIELMTKRFISVLLQLENEKSERFNAQPNPKSN